MCGIFGVINRTGVVDTRLGDFFSNAAIAGAVRGVDGIGVYQIDDHTPSGKKLVYTYKRALAAQEFMEEQNANGIFYDARKSFVTMGHNRAATAGVISDRNCHPFAVVRDDRSTFVGVHNGTLYGWDQEPLASKCQVDSEWAMHTMAADGIKESIPKFYGAMAFALYDSRTPSKVYLYTNGERPLHFAFVEGSAGSKVLVASEAEMLYWLATRNKLKVEKGVVYAARKDMLYTFDGNSDLREYTSEKISSSATMSTGADYSQYATGSQAHYYANSQPGWRNSNTGNYSHNPRSGIEAMVRGLMAEISDSSTTTTNATALVEAPVSTPRVTTRTPRSNPEESMLLTSLEVLPGSEVVFEGEQYVERTVGVNNAERVSRGDLIGTVILETAAGVEDIYFGVVRNVRKEEAERWLKRPALVKALGAYLQQREAGRPSGSDIYVTVTPPIRMLEAGSVREIH